MLNTPTPRRFGILLFEGFSNFCLANAVEPLRAANDLSGRLLYSWEFLALDQTPVTSSSGLPVHAARLEQTHVGDVLLVMPSYGHKAQDTPRTRDRLRDAARRFDVIVGLDTGSWLLAAAGLLDGHRATSHWDILTELSERFPDLDIVQDRFVIDGARASCGGAITTFELMLELISRDHGAPLALEVAALFMFGEHETVFDPKRLVGADQTLRAAAAVMRRHLESPLTIAEVAERVGLSQRSLDRLFRAKSGRTPREIYRRIRLQEARRRVTQTRESIAEIAGRSGYADATAMTRAFRAEYGLSPQALRKSLST